MKKVKNSCQLYLSTCLAVFTDRLLVPGLLSDGNMSTLMEICQLSLSHPLIMYSAYMLSRFTHVRLLATLWTAAH